ncbi:MAG TPA: hypothetical protein VM265_07955 [Sphingomicrobium sp.]|nr:hypothetical protein [Sphingomicrobium sp.]
MTGKQRLVASAVAAAIAAAAIAGLAGWVVLLVIIAMIGCGMIALAAEAARPLVRREEEADRQ